VKKGFLTQGGRDWVQNHLWESALDCSDYNEFKN